jgi:valyl-tRNA synthetase
MNNTYNPLEIEQKWYPIWEQQGHFVASGEGKSFSIVIPPPNVTGRLHMGHGFQHTLMDVLVRYHRMQGDNTLWQVGTDHAGISTQMVVERLLASDNISRHDLGREKFEERVWEWKHESGGHITQQMRRLGNSTDWQRERFTMDDDLSDAVSKVFIQLYDEGLIYRGKRLVNWDPVLLTAISDVEVLNEDREGFLWHIRYPLKNSADYLIVATTRPETMLGDTAVAVHPEDERYQHLIGQSILLPLSDREIPIIADDYVDKDFGTGCVKITPAHDFNDYEMGLRHQLPMINIFTPDAKINENAPEKYQGLDRFVAREHIIADLKAANLLEKIEPHQLKLPIGDRGGAVIEPYLTDQWYVNIKPLAAPAIDVVKQGKVRFIPENWSKTYFQWMENIQDWCISRQLWWGHRIPAWYDDAGKVYVADSETAVREKYKLDDAINLRQETDVLDTWFSSALWPFSTFGWPEQTPELQQFYPTTVLITGFDIIFFWVARMIMFGLKFAGDVPFKDVYITGLIRDEHGQKMSKTKGNVLDPIDLVDGIALDALVKKRTHGLMQTHLVDKIIANTEKQFPEGIKAHGMDALRFTYCSLASTGRDIRFDLGRLEGYRNFGNKIWNAARFVMMNTSAVTRSEHQQTKDLSIVDRWILDRLQHVTQEVRKQLDQYRFDLASQALYEFIWNEYCDWYLELCKPVLYGDNNDAVQKQATQQTLLIVLDAWLRLLHPFMPFITEEIWQELQNLMPLHNSTSIMLAPYPVVEQTCIDDNARASVELIKQLIVAVRSIRSEMNVSPSKQVCLLLDNANSNEQAIINENFGLIVSLAKLSDIQWLNGQQPPAAAAAIAGTIDVYIPLAGLIDVAAETERLKKEIAKLEAEVARSSSKLQNPAFVDKAPPAVVAKEQANLAEHQTNLAKFNEQLVKLASL